MAFKKGHKVNAGKSPERYNQHKEHYRGKDWFNKKLKEYLKKRKDKEYEFHKTRGDKSDSYEEKINAKLPTVEGFADFIGFTKPTLYNWAKKHKEVKLGIDKIVNQQLVRLIDRGLEGTYNSTIAKLILSSNHGMKEKSDVTTDNQPIPLLDYITKKKSDKKT
ncbi:MAG: terminase small subunit [Methanogenium sp.]|jgi:hypothetical protein